MPDSDLSRARLTLAAVQTAGPPTHCARRARRHRSTRTDSSGSLALRPGRYRLNGAVPLPQGSGPGPGWTLLSAVAKGQDVLDFPIEIGPNDEIKDVVVTFTDSVRRSTAACRMRPAAPRPTTPSSSSPRTTGSGRRHRGASEARARAPTASLPCRTCRPASTGSRPWWMSRRVRSTTRRFWSSSSARRSSSRWPRANGRLRI